MRRTTLVRTPLHEAAYGDAVEAAKYLVGAGADIHAKDNLGETPLHEAAYGDAVEAAKYLVGAGADIHAKDNLGETPLHEAAYGDRSRGGEVSGRSGSGHPCEGATLVRRRWTTASKQRA